MDKRYRIQRALGKGGCGQTFLAEDTYMPSKRLCVIKQLKPATNDPDACQIIKDRFIREAAILETIGKSCDQIPELYSFFEDAGEFYLVQEYVEGQTLTQKVLNNGILDVDAVKDILLSLLLLLDEIHAQGIIHRDIKPDNVILRQQDNVPVLIDFGAVKEIITTIVNPNAGSSSIVIGSQGYMSLEQSAGRPVFASDIYSLGLTAIYLLTGKHPQEMVEPSNGAIFWLKYTPYGVNHNFSKILHKAIEPFAQNRYQTAKEMISALFHRIEWCTPFMYKVLLERISGANEISSKADIDKAIENYRKDYERTHTVK